MLFRLLLVAILGFFGTSKNVFGQTSYRLIDVLTGPPSAEHISIGTASACVDFRPHPNGDCQAFVRCVGNTEFIMKCGPGTAFNPKFDGCDYPQNVECPGTGSSTPELTTPPVTTTTMASTTPTQTTPTPTTPTQTTPTPTTPTQTTPAQKHHPDSIEPSVTSGPDSTDSPVTSGPDTSGSSVTSGPDSTEPPVTSSPDSTDSPVTSGPDTIPVRLAGGNSLNRGRVEIQYNGQWGTICDDSWDDRDARVVCQMLGYVDGSAIGTFGGGTGPIWLDDVDCQGSESSIVDCVRDPWGAHNCGHHEDAGVECSNTTIVVSVRLAGGNSLSWGRVEIQYNGQWGTICDDRWDDRDARVVCQMLGYVGGTAQGNARYGPGTGRIWLDEVNCLGNERSIDQCRKNDWGQHDCRHTEDASVVCTLTTQQPATPLSIRLMDGNDTSNGRVEILYRGNWGTVCDDQWDDSDAHVICYMLGYSGGTAQGNALYGPGTGIIWLDEVNCLGNETSIDQCGKNAWGQHDCQHTEDAGVDCSFPTFPTTQQPMISTGDNGQAFPTTQQP